MKKVVVVGGGPCGLVSIRRLREALGPEELQITLITKDKYHYFPPLFADLALGEVKLDEIRAPAENIARLYKTDFILDEVIDVDLANRKVKTKGGKEVDYDYLLVCAGVRNAPEVVPGLAEYGYHPYTLEDALKMKEALENFKGGKVLFLIPEFPFRCPGYPFEMAAKLIYLARRKGGDAQVTLTLPAPMNMIMNIMQDIAMTAHYLHSKFGNISYVFDKRPKEVKEGKVIFDDGTEESYDLLLYGPPSRPQKAFEKDELLCPGDRRWMATTFPTFRNPKYDDVFVPTDAALPCIGLPPAGVNVHEAAVSAADTIIADVTGVRATKPFPKQVPLIADFGMTGLMVVFEILGTNNDGKVKTRKYVALTSPLLRNMKLSYYLGWIASLKV